MSAPLALGSRRAGRLAAGGGAVLSLGLASYTAVTQADPALHLLDGYWMLGGASVAVVALAPFAWRWRRERALVGIAIAALVGAWLPIVGLAIRVGVPVPARIKGAMFFSSADVIGLALPVGFTLLWLALQEHRGSSPTPPPP